MSVTATARVRAVADGRGGTALPVLESDGPLALRRTRAAAPYTGVTLVGAMSAPLGGDRLAVDVDAGEGTRLRVGAAAATVALPGPGPAHYDVRLSVGDEAELHWLPEQLISARGSELRMTTTVELAATARLVYREEQVLGRHGEATGALATRLTVRRRGRPLLDQELSYGPGAAGGWDGPAVLGGHRAVGQLLFVMPEFEERPVMTRLLGPTAVLAPLAGPAALVTAVATDARRLRILLDEATALVQDGVRAGQPT
ncbi:urease accessory protein UreD [Streptomyces sp. NBC_01218]|uniref:urease accessory protein UreD n=1 Tax=Streptomyces sp. NBC_01218 TaxID=2903780 RepID=UPI002E0E8F4B|nr:urease accessory protein UreD [Streptomyces sp. NBC_01218]